VKNYDVIVIGGGLGGLTAGAKLAKDGKRVLLVESHNIPGGCATTFKRKGMMIEVGLHEIDGLDPDDLKLELIDDLKIREHVQFVRVPDFFRFRNESGNLDFVIPENREKARQYLEERFPEEKKAIVTFFKTIRSIRRELSQMPKEGWKNILLRPIFPLLYPYFMAATNKAAAVLFPLFPILNPRLLFTPLKTLGSFLDSITKNETLKIVLSANIGYYHDDPWSMSMLYFSVAQSGYFDGGGHFIKGGSQQLSNYLSSIITDHGGTVLLGRLVTKIIMKNQMAVGIQHQKTSSKIVEIQEEAFAPIIIANTAIPNVINLLPKDFASALLRKTEKMIPSCSLLSIYFGFKSNLQDLGNKNYSTFVCPDQVQTLKEYCNPNQNNFADRGFVFVDYGQIDSQLAPFGKSVGVICTIDYLRNWENLDSVQYKKKKDEIADLFLIKLEKLIPGISQEVIYCEVGTPKTIQRYTLNPGGSVYGYAQIPSQAIPTRIANKSPITGLYFASAWATPGGGFTGAMLSGWFCAKEILRG
jgi:phytoene dehydrogenase-like protein